MTASGDKKRANSGTPGAYRREREEPMEKPNPIPIAFMVFAAVIVLWGISYFYLRTGSITGAGDMRTPVAVATERSTGGAVDGGAVYAANCAACHQASGSGIAGVFPPLNGSGWVRAKPAVPVQILLHGITGKISVKSQTYQGTMPSFSSLLDSEIAAVVTYIRQSWSNNTSAVDAKFVAAQRKVTADRDGSWNGGVEIRKAVGEPKVK